MFQQKHLKKQFIQFVQVYSFSLQFHLIKFKIHYKHFIANLSTIKYSVSIMALKISCISLKPLLAWRKFHWSLWQVWPSRFPDMKPTGYFFGTCKAPSVQRQDFECTTLAATDSKSCSTYNSRYPRECVARAATPFGPM